MRALLLGAIGVLIALIVAIVWAGTTRECDDTEAGARGVSLNRESYPLEQVSTAVICVESTCTDFTVDPGTAWMQSQDQDITGTVQVSVQLRDGNGVVLVEDSIRAQVQAPPTGSHLGSASCAAQGYISVSLQADGTLRETELVEG